MKTAKVKKPIYKRVWFWLIVLFAIGIVGTGNNNSSSQQKSSSAKESTTPSITAEPIREYDILQKMFINLTFDTSIEDIEKAIEMNKLVHTRKEYKGSKAIEYTIGYTSNGRARNPIQGDTIEVNFDIDDLTFKYAVYTHIGESGSGVWNSGFYIKEGTYFDLRVQSQTSGGSGYYGTAVGSHEYNKFETAEETLEFVLEHKK